MRTQILAIATLFFAVASTSCQSLRKGSSQLQHAGFQPDYDFHKSIGLLVHRSETPPTHLGTGFIVAEMDDRYIGVTVQKVLSSCLSVRPPRAADCWLSLPLDRDQKQVVYERVEDFDGNHQGLDGWQALFPHPETGLAFFSIKKTGDNTRLIPLELTGNLLPGEPLTALLAGYGPTGKLVRSSGVTWRPQGESEAETMVTTFPPGMAGAPVFTFVPSGTDYRMVWKVVGVSVMGTSHPQSIVPIRRLMGLRDQHPTWALWSKVSYDRKMVPNKVGHFEILSGTAKQDTDGWVAVRLVLPSADWDLKRLYLNSVQASQFETVSLSRENGKGIFEARVAMGNTPALLPDLVFEYRNLADFLMFAACFRESAQIGQETALRCGFKPTR